MITHFFKRHGCWGVCNTYGAWFATGALSLAKEFKIGDVSKIDATLKKGYDFLLSKQHADGGWGEDFKVRPSTFILSLILLFSLAVNADGLTYQKDM